MNSHRASTRHSEECHKILVWLVLLKIWGLTLGYLLLYHFQAEFLLNWRYLIDLKQKNNDETKNGCGADQNITHFFEYNPCRTALLSVPKQQSQESHWKLTYSANAHFFLKLTRKKWGHIHCITHPLHLQYLAITVLVWTRQKHNYVIMFNEDNICTLFTLIGFP